MVGNGSMAVVGLPLIDPAHLSIRSKPARRRLVRVATTITSNPYQIQIKGSAVILNSTKVRRLSSEGRSAAEKERMSKRTNICISEFKIVCKRLV